MAGWDFFWQTAGSFGIDPTHWWGSDNYIAETIKLEALQMDIYTAEG